MKRIFVLLLTILSLLACQASVAAGEKFDDAQFEKQLSSGKPVLVVAHAPWCPTCRAQDKVFKTFQGDASVPGTLLLVDYDTERDLKREMNVRSQATLIVFQGKTQVSRSGGVTDPEQLRAELLKPN